MNRQISLGIVGAEVDKGQKKDGVQRGPDILRLGLISDVINRLGINYTDYGNVSQFQKPESDLIMKCRNQRAFVKTSRELADVTEKSVSENNLTMVLGGDHSIAYGSIWGQVRSFPNTFVVWVDAHADLNTPEVSHTGSMHGMPVGFLLKDTNEKIPKTQGFELLPPVLGPENFLYIGLRDVEPAELEYIKESNIRYFTMDHVKRLGIEKVMDLTLKAISNQKNCSIHLSFDIDSLDPIIAPSTGTCVSGGLTLEEGKIICRSLAITGQLKSVSMVEVNPDIGSLEDSKKTVSAAIELLESCIYLE